MNERTRWLIPILIIVLFAGWVVWPNNSGIHLEDPQVDIDISVHQGLDLQGGLQVLLEADLPPDQPVTADQLNNTRHIIESRVNGLGVTEPLVQVQGDRRIVVELPGVDDPEQAVETLKETGLLEFVDVGLNPPPDGATIQTSFAQSAAPTATPEGAATSEATAAPTAAASPTAGSTSEASATPEASPTPAPTPECSPAGPVYCTVMTGAMLEDALVGLDELNRYVINFTLTDEGAGIFGDFTSTHIGQQLAIVLDKTVLSAPVIESAITEGQGTITGSFALEEANQLVIQLRYGALPVPLKVVQSQTVGPTLGQDSVRASLIAGVIGLATVALFMGLYYRLPGVLADVALLVYALVTFALFKIIPVTLTLPGIAGFILSVGVAVDANILIFERMKEELRAGRNLLQAVDIGFSRAWPSIRDSNISTLITCGILYWFGNTFGASVVKGFAFTLAIGVFVSLFSAITVTRTILHLILDRMDFTERHAWFGI